MLACLRARVRSKSWRSGSFFFPEKALPKPHPRKISDGSTYASTCLIEADWPPAGSSHVVPCRAHRLRQVPHVDGDHTDGGIGAASTMPCEWFREHSDKFQWPPFDHAQHDGVVADCPCFSAELRVLCYTSTTHSLHLYSWWAPRLFGQGGAILGYNSARHKPDLMTTTIRTASHSSTNKRIRPRSRLGETSQDLHRLQCAGSAHRNRVHHSARMPLNHMRRPPPSHFVVMRRSADTACLGSENDHARRQTCISCASRDSVGHWTQPLHDANCQNLPTPACKYAKLNTSISPRLRCTFRPHPPICALMKHVCADETRRSTINMPSRSFSDTSR
jgi:hypothetical protein